MKFRGKIFDFAPIKDFSQLLQSLSKVAKQMIFRIAPAQIMFILREKEVKANGVTSWCEFPAEKLFNDYIMEGHSANENEILLEISLEYLASVLSGLKSSHKAKALRLKLTRKCVPCLTVEIDTQMQHSVSTCIHDIPVTIVPPRHWNEYQPPRMPIFNISLALPDVKIVRKTIERLRNNSPRLTITAKADTPGKIILSTESISVKASITYPELKVYEIDGKPPSTAVSDEDDNNDGPPSFSVDVEMKNLIQILPTESLKATSSICSVLDKRLVHFFYIFGDATLHFCIPSISLNE